jgi:hypothetical protein
MKKLLLILSLFTFNFSFLVCHSQSWCWGAGGLVNLKSNEPSSPVATNRTGNAYITGEFETVIIFGKDTLKNNGENVYIVKYNSNGAVQWAKTPYSTSLLERSYGTSIVSDAQDNAYITGQSGGWDLIFGTDTVTGNGFLVKYGPTGQVLWAKTCNGVALTIDKNGNICVATPAALLKFNPNGNNYMNKSISYNSINTITTDSLLNIYATGYYDTLVGSRQAEIPYVLKYDSSGNLLWERHATIATIYSAGYGNSVITDRAGNVYLAGFFVDTVSFGSHALISPLPYVYGGYSMFLSKYDANGNLIWINQTTDYSAWRGTSLDKDKNNFIYLGGGGFGANTLHFGGGAVSYPLPYSNSSFILKLDTSGKLVSGSLLKNGMLGYPASDYYNKIAVDSSGNYSFVTGSFNDTVICGNDTLSDGSAQANYIARWSETECTNSNEGINQITASGPGVIVYPNPSHGVFAFEVKSVPSTRERTKSVVEVYNMLGQQVLSQSFNIQNLSTGQVDSEFKINLNAQPSGIYLYRVISGNGQLIGTGKLIIEK